jgi:A/G-specific adenine glycosylase
MTDAVAADITAPGLALDLATLRAPLLAWYDAHKRDMPWRAQVSAYRTLVSEVMLQQTQVAVVRDYFDRWMRRFPTLADLARAPIDDVLAAWSGLGYYRRAHNLHALACAVMARHGGEFPERFEELLALPGVGRYTAGAIASIAFQQPYPVVDGNVARVLCRLLAIDGDPTAPAVQKRLWAHASALVDPARPGDLNQALMELGATLCTKAKPRCADCPWLSACEAARLGLQSSLPSPKKKPKRQRVAALSLWLQAVGDDGEPLVLLAQRPAKGLWSGLWELPTFELERVALASARSSASAPAVDLLSERAAARLRALCAAHLGLDALPALRPLPMMTQALTHLDWLIAPWQATLPPAQALPTPRLDPSLYAAWRWRSLSSLRAATPDDDGADGTDGAEDTDDNTDTDAADDLTARADDSASMGLTRFARRALLAP